ncbi:MAG: peptide ABC transporter substrate-binding protein, partial [Bdellovibrionales bacterium]|nr:peptide ABC transporter substrate-binding protein [Bdellovibrionales bacterium]
MILNKTQRLGIQLVLISLIAASQVKANKSNQTEGFVKGGSIVLTMAEEPESLNPISSISGYANEIQSWICDSLLKRNSETYEWEPSIAEKWSLSEDNKSVTYTLRSDLFFHDGTAVTPEDVKFSIEVASDQRFDNWRIRPYFENIEKVEVKEKQTIKITFKNSYFKNFEIVSTQFIIPKHVYGDPEKSKKITEQLIGSGPYKLAKFNRGQGVDLVKFDKHYSESESNIKRFYNYDEIKYKFIADENIKLEKIKKGEVDFIEWRNSEIFDKRAVGGPWGKTVLKYKVENKIPKSWSYIGWNLRKKIFQDKDVRKALAYLVNRQVINKKLFNNNSLLLGGPISPVSVYAPKLKPILYDPQKALELLKNSGWSDSDKDGLLDKEIDGKKVDFRFTLIF